MRIFRGEFNNRFGGHGTYVDVLIQAKDWETAAKIFVKDVMRMTKPRSMTYMRFVDSFQGGDEFMSVTEVEFNGKHIYTIERTDD